MSQATGDVQCSMEARELLQNPFRATNPANELCPDDVNANVRLPTNL